MDLSINRPALVNDFHGRTSNELSCAPPRMLPIPPKNLQLRCSMNPTPRHNDSSVAARASASSSAIGSITAAAAISLSRRPSPSQSFPSPTASPSAKPDAQLPQDSASTPLALVQDEADSAEGAAAVPMQALSSERTIKLIATDVDGTLLDSRQRLSERTERALRLAMEQGVQVVLATGKARGPWFPEVKESLQLTTPSVFLQGLLVCSPDGTVLYERTLEDELAQEIIAEAEGRGITLTAYCGDRILCSETDAHTDRLIGYGEPTPEAVGPLSSIIGNIPIHKMLFMSDDNTLALLRRQLEVQLAGRATLVTALHGMLEVLPLGASKAVGLSRVLGMLEVNDAHVLAAGDGENDIEMLRMAGLAVAMGNASCQVKQEAQYVSNSNDQDGLAHAVEKFVLKPGFWCWD